MKFYEENNLQKNIFLWPRNGYTHTCMHTCVYNTQRFQELYTDAFQIISKNGSVLGKRLLSFYTVITGGVNMKGY